MIQSALDNHSKPLRKWLLVDKLSFAECATLLREEFAVEVSRQGVQQWAAKNSILAPSSEMTHAQAVKILNRTEKRFGGHGQYKFIHAAKVFLNIGWDEMSERTGIPKRALKMYRMPESSPDHRPMSEVVEAQVRQALTKENPLNVAALREELADVVQQIKDCKTRTKLLENRCVILRKQIAKATVV